MIPDDNVHPDLYPALGLFNGLMAAAVFWSVVAAVLLAGCAPPRVVPGVEDPCLTHARTVSRGVPCPDTPAVVPDSFRVYEDSTSYDFPVTRVLYCGPSLYRDSLPTLCQEVDGDASE